MYHRGLERRSGICPIIIMDSLGSIWCGNPEDYPSSLSPDMLDNIECINMEPMTVRPVWITVNIPRDAKPGAYMADVMIKAKGRKTQRFTLNLNVINQILSQPKDWTMHMDMWQHPSAIARIHNDSVWSDEHFEHIKPYMQRAADMGQKVITATLNKDPWNNQCFDPYADMIIWTKNVDGSWSYDYTAFDKWVQLMMNLGIDKMINCYSMIPWNNEIHYTDGKDGKVVEVKADPGALYIFCILNIFHIKICKKNAYFAYSD